MTALEDYAKLEALGQYLETSDAPGREVVLSFGERTLLIADLEDQPLAHWPLASLRALPDAIAGKTVLVPDPDSAERVLLDDAEMIAAIGQVCPDLRAQPEIVRPRRPLGRWLVLLILAVVFGAAGWVALNRGFLADHVSQERAVLLGEMIADGLGPGQPRVCVAPDGVVALARLVRRLTERGGLATPRRLAILDDMAPGAHVLPGGLVLVSRGMLEEASSPEALAGLIAPLLAMSESGDALRMVIEAVDVVDGAGLVLGGHFGEDLVTAGIRNLVDGVPGAERSEQAARRAMAGLAAAGLPAGPGLQLVRSLAPRAGPLTGFVDQAAALPDPVGDGAFEPALKDRDWLVLRNICDRVAGL